MSQEAMEVSIWLLWLFVGLLFLLVLLLYRQWGLSLLSPGERVNQGGLDLGQRAPTLDSLFAESAPNVPADAAGDWTNGKANAVALFVIPNCPVCADLKEELEEEGLGTYGRASRFVLVEKVSPDASSGVTQQNGMTHIMIHDPDDIQFARFDVQQAPFAYVISSDQRIAGKRLVNSVAGIESLLVEAGAEKGKQHNDDS